MNINEFIKELENEKNRIAEEIQKKQESERRAKEKERKHRLICRKFTNYCENNKLNLVICINNKYRFEYFDVFKILFEISDNFEIDIVSYTINESDLERKIKVFDHIERIIKAVNNIVDDINHN